MSVISTAFVFPGQGSQKVGMGSAWVDEFDEAKGVFEAADEALGFSLSELCRQGPEEELRLTANTQPAILTASIAVYRVLESKGITPNVVGGHSLGEYSALVAAGALRFDDAVRLVRRRGEFMQRAVPVGEGAMAAVIGLDGGVVAEIAADAAGDGVCSVANLNSAEQTVIAGSHAAVERAVRIAGERGARRAILLPVSAPFHCSLMAPARKEMTPLLEEVEFLDPRIPVVCNVDARPVTKAAAARDALMRQIDGTVRWSESVLWMAEELGVERFVEVGPGSVLSGLIRRTVKGTRPIPVSEPSALEKLQ